MPLGDNALPILEDTIRKATAAAHTADNIADTCIKVSLRQRIAAGEALAAARELIPPAAWPDWLAQIGIAPARQSATLSFRANTAAGAP